jgi:hypothetical protein
MKKTLTGFLGTAQGIFGILGATVGSVGRAVGTAPSGNIFNIVSGAALGALGFGTSEKVQNVGVPVVSVLNAIVGVLGIVGVQNIGSLNLNNGLPSNLINIGVAVLGFIFTFLKGKKR